MASAPNPSSTKVEQSEEAPQSTADMTAFVQNLLVQMQSRFQTMSDNIVSKNEMGCRINELEESINDLKTEVGGDGATKSTPEGAKPTEES